MGPVQRGHAATLTRAFPGPPGAASMPVLVPSESSRPTSCWSMAPLPTSSPRTCTRPVSRAVYTLPPTSAYTPPLACTRRRLASDRGHHANGGGRDAMFMCAMPT